MGKRSRKRGAPADAPASGGASGSSRAERDAARARRAEATARRRAAAQARGRTTAPPSRRRGRPTIDERPDAPWGKFPLVELVVLLALILFGASFFVGGRASARTPRCLRARPASRPWRWCSSRADAAT
jgi:hypothetical protein